MLWKRIFIKWFTKISKFFQLFDSIDECYSDLKKKFDDNNYEILLHEIKEKIIIKIKTNIVNKDFVLDIPIKKLEQEKTYYKFISSKPNNNYIIEKNWWIYR